MAQTSANHLPGLRNQRQRDEIDMKVSKKEEQKQSTQVDQGIKDQKVSKESSNPEEEVEEKNKCRKFPKKLIIPLILLFIAIGIIVGILLFKRESFHSNLISTYQVPNSDQKMKVHNWTLKKPNLFSQSQQIKGQAITFHSKHQTRLLKQNSRLLSESNGQDLSQSSGYVIQHNEEAGVSMKYLSGSNAMLQFDPDQNFAYYDKHHPEETKRLLAITSLRRLQEKQPPQDYLKQYIGLIHQTYAELLGVDKESTEAAYAPSFKGHDENGLFVIQHSNQQSSRLLYTLVQSQYLSSSERSAYFDKVRQSVKAVAQRNIEDIQKVGCWAFCGSINIRFRLLFRLLQEQEEESQQQAENKQGGKVVPPVAPMCKPHFKHFISGNAWKVIQECSVQGSNWICTQKEWFSSKPIFQRTKQCKQNEKHYRSYNRYIAYLKQQPGRDCDQF